MKRVLSVLLGCVLLCSIANASPLSVLSDKLKAIQTLTATFDQKVVSTGGVVLQTSSGKLALQRPGLFRWQIIKPLPQLMVADGKELWLYDESLEQVTRHRLKQDSGQTPALLLSGNLADIQKAFTVTRDRTAAGDNWFILKPTAPQASFAKVSLKFQGDTLEAMKMRDKLGQETLIHFAQVSSNASLDPSLFQFVPPKGVDVIQQ